MSSKSPEHFAGYAVAPYLYGFTIAEANSIITENLVRKEEINLFSFH